MVSEGRWSTPWPYFNICNHCRPPCGPGDSPATCLQGFSPFQSSYTGGRLSSLFFFNQPPPYSREWIHAINPCYQCGVSRSRERVKENTSWCCSFSSFPQSWGRMDKGRRQSLFCKILPTHFRIDSELSTPVGSELPGWGSSWRRSSSLAGNLNANRPLEQWITIKRSWWTNLQETMLPKGNNWPSRVLYCFDKMTVHWG